MKEVIVKMTSDHIKVKGGEYVRDYQRGEWIGDKCSVCGNERAWYGCNPPFCPDCGASMREREGE